MKRKRRLKEERRKSELSTPSSSGEGEACLSMEVKSEDLMEKERATEGEQQYLSVLETSKTISCSEKML